MRQRTGLISIILAYVVLGATYALATPPLEASDEYKHYPVVQYVQTHRALPVLDPDDPGIWLQEAAQPPLYYLMAAALTATIDTDDLPELYQMNPHAFVGNPTQVTNKNLIVHDPDRESFPWHGAVLAIYLIRFASIGLGAGTVLLTARMGSILFRPTVGLLAAALTAFNPMFLFASAAVNNDSLAILLGHLGLYLLVRLWQDVPDPRVCWRRYVGLGAVLGLGMLTKLSLGGLLALTGVALGWLSWRRRKWRLLLLGGAIVAAVALGVSGWWFAHNLRVYGDPTGLDVFIAVQGTRDGAITWRDWVGEFGTFYRAYWGLFGGVNVAAPEPYYWICNLAALLGAGGLLLWLKRKRPQARDGLSLLAIWAIILFLLLLRWTIVSSAFQGRLIFPALGALNVLWVIGLAASTNGSRRPHLALVASVWMLGTATLLPWVTIRPAYSYPEPLTAVPEPVQFGPITFKANDGAIQLVGVEMHTGQSTTPAGEPVEVTLYWQAIHPMERDYVSSIHLLGRNHVSVGQVNRYPAWGMIPTSRWEAGQVWRDVYRIYVDADAIAPTRLRMSVGVYDTQESSPLPPFGPDDTPMELVMIGEARLGRGEGRPLEPPALVEMSLTDGIILTGYSLVPQPAAPGDTLTLTLYWEATAQPAQEYTVFVHLLSQDNSIIAGADGPPVAGDYPTSLWQPGDQVDDSHAIFLPPDLASGIYQIVVGLYNPTTGFRAARLDGTGDSISLPAKIEAR